MKIFNKTIKKITQRIRGEEEFLKFDKIFQ